MLPTLLNYIQTPDVLKMYNAMLALRKLTKRYEYKSDAERKPLNDIVQISFPILQVLITQIVLNNHIEAAQVIRMVLKIFWSATHYALPAAGGVDVALWFNIFGQLLEKKLPEASENLEPLGQPLTKEERDAWPWWKMKKWVARIINQFMARYGNPMHCAAENKAFATHFRSNTGPTLLGSVMRLLGAHHAQGQYISEPVHRSCLSFLANAVEMSPTYKIIKPHLEFLIIRILFPTLQISDSELRLFQDDPIEFVRKVHNPLEDWQDPRVAAINVLQTLARYRQKDTLPMLLNFCIATLTEYSNTAVVSRDHRKKDGVMVAVAAVAKIMSDSKKYAAQLLPFISVHIVPEFQSPVAYMRCRACWSMEYFVDQVNWSEAPQLLQLVLQGLLQGLKDPSLPTQTAAACALRPLISAEGAKELLRPVVHDIVSEYFRIMSEVETDAVLSALQTIVTEYGEDIISIAPTITAKLVGAYNHYTSAGDDEDEAVFCAAQCLETIMTVLDVCKDDVGVMAQLEAATLPVITNMFTVQEDSLEYLDMAVQMLGTLTYYQDTISQGLWNVFAPMLVALDDWAFDYLQEFSVPLFNFISKDTLTFLQGSYKGVSYLDMLIALVSKAFDSNRDNVEREAKAAARLLCCVISCCRGRIDRYIGVSMQLVASRLEDAGTSSFRIKLLEIAMTAIYYDPQLISEIFRSDPVTTENLFKHMFDKLPQMVRPSSQRLIVLSFSSLMAMPLGVLPVIVRTNLKPMLSQALREVESLEKDEEEEEEEDGDNDVEEEDDNNVGEDGDNEGGVESEGVQRRSVRLTVPDDGYDEDEDCIDVQAEEYRNILEAAETSDTVKRQLFAHGEYVPEDDDDEEEEDDDDFVSPIDTIDVGLCLCQNLLLMEQREPQLMMTLRNDLNEEDKTRLATLFESKIHGSR